MSFKRLSACVAAFAVAGVTALVLGATAVGNHSLTDLISVGQINGSGTFDAAVAGTTTDGTRVWFVTNEPLVSADTDTAQDLYERAGGTTTLVSVGQINGNGDFDANYLDSSADGKHVFFWTNEALVSADTDAGCMDEGDPGLRPCRDIYERFNGVTTLLSAGANGSFDADYAGSSTDGSRVFIETGDQLSAADTDSATDVYERSGGTSTLLSTGPAGGNGAFPADFGAASPDGTRVIFMTDESLVSSDTDGGCLDENNVPGPCRDIYERFGGTTTLLSVGGNGTFDVGFGGASTDATKVVFVTDEPLLGSDTDAGYDVYSRSGGTTTLVSAGQINGNGNFDAAFAYMSGDGTRIFFTTDEPLVAGDTDTSIDLYERTGGTTALASGGQINGNGAFNVFFRGATPDGTHMYFTTAEPLVAADTDASQDVYERTGGVTSLVSSGQINGNGAFTAAFRGNSADGSRVFFTTRERLNSADSDPVGLTCLSSTCSVDVYERFGGVTYLISLGPTLDNGNKNATWGGASADGLRVFYNSGKAQVAADTDTIQDVYQTSVAQPGFARPKGASPTRVALVPAFAACTASNSTHGAPLSFASCAPPVQASQQLTMGTPDANGTPTNFSGFFRLAAILGNTSTQADEADLKLVVSMSDVRVKTTLADYTGELQASLSLRLTDKLSGSYPQDTGTVQDTSFKFAVPCTATAATNVGSNCAVNTTAEAVVPNVITENGRNVWQLGQIQINDGGPDGIASTSPNTLFLVQGLLAP